MRVSVVVPTYRRAGMLDRCLAALAAQDLDPADYEILIADDAASAETRRQVEDWARRAGPPVRYLPVQPAHGPAAARNTASSEPRTNAANRLSWNVVPNSVTVAGS